MKTLNGEGVIQIATQSTKIKKFKAWLELIYGKSFKDIKLTPGELKMYLDLRHGNFRSTPKPDETIRDSSQYYCETFDAWCEEMTCSYKYFTGITGIVTDCEFCLKLEKGVK